MSRAGMIMLFRAQLASVEAELKAKHAEIASLRAAQEAAEAKIEELTRHREHLKSETDQAETGSQD